MNIILLSGGSGKRLWPLSDGVQSKQFIKIFKKQDGNYESMIQRIYRQIKDVDENGTITIATTNNQVSIINNQIGNNVNFSVEPCCKDTFPAIVLAISYLYDIKKFSEEEIVIICPVDSYVDEAYFKTFEKMEKVVQTKDVNLVLMGIKPTYPSEKYGYIIPLNSEDINWISEFKEKPDLQTAKKYIDQGALWNGGVFATKIKYILDKAHKLIKFNDYNDLYNKYKMLDKISFDYAIVESEPKIQVCRFTGMWKDVGTWNDLIDVTKFPVLGDALLDKECANISVINRLNIPMICMGLKDMIIMASPNGILISDKKRSEYIKPYVDKIRQFSRIAEKSWGTFQILNFGENSLTVKIMLNAGKKMSYHSHCCRDELWNIISGKGIAILDGKKRIVEVGDSIIIKSGNKHSLIAISNLEIIEIQLGEHISASDKIKYDL